VIIKFLSNEGADAQHIADAFLEQFGQHTYQLRKIRFWIAEAWLGHQDMEYDIRTRTTPLDDLEMKILAILDKSPFE
jgi:hypothetical protein